MARKGEHHKSPKALHFKNKADYERWLAYDKAHHLHGKGKKPEVYIHGKKHHVNHSSRKKSSRKSSHKSSRKRSSRKRR